MFKFFSEIKKELNIPIMLDDYNIVNLSGKALYVEGIKGLLMLSESQVMFKVKEKIISVFGSNLKLKEIGKETLMIVGKIERIEAN